jgi:transcriptional regulator with XRE-family HTH domain
MSTDQANIDTSSFGAYLRSLRLYGRGIADGRTQREVAAEVGLSVVGYSKIEAHREPPPDMVTLGRIVHALDADVAVVLRLLGDWQPAPPDPPGWAIACGPSGCRVQRVGE